MENQIFYLDKNNLNRETRDHLVNNKYPNLYWSDDWSVDFYQKQAELGFIATAFQDQERAILLPELQYSYAVLFWKNLRIDRGVQKLLALKDKKPSIRTDTSCSVETCFQLKVHNDISQVLRHLTAVRPDKSWLIQPYQRLMEELTQKNSNPAPQNFCLWAVVLETPEGIAAGELGYTIGRTYSSLSGFHYRHNSYWNHYGKLQMVLLARHLENRGIEFWNMGHPHFLYKKNLGAQEIERKDFFTFWDQGVEHNSLDLTLMEPEYHDQAQNSSHPDKLAIPKLNAKNSP